MAVAAIVSPTSSLPGAVAPAVNSAARKRRQNPGGGDAAAPKVAKAAKAARVVEAAGAAPDAGPGAVALPSPLGPAPVVTVCHPPGAKRPQMKYDPSVPMSKEATSAWRREQRRKRNRESAAACRRRQRDRISELEGEAAAWRARFDDALGRLAELEGEEARKELEETLVRTIPIVPWAGRPEAKAGQQPKAAAGVERCGTPPIVPQVPSSSQALSTDMSHVISPCDRLKLVPPTVTSAMDSSLTHDQLENLAFPVLEDPILQLPTSGPDAVTSGSRPYKHKGQVRSQLKSQVKAQAKAQPRAKQGFQADARRKRVKIPGGHLSENITPARPRLIDFYTRPGRRGRWTDGIGHSSSSQ